VCRLWCAVHPGSLAPHVSSRIYAWEPPAWPLKQAKHPPRPTVKPAASKGKGKAKAGKTKQPKGKGGKARASGKPSIGSNVGGAGAGAGSGSGNVGKENGKGGECPVAIVKPPTVVFPPGLTNAERFQLQWAGRELPNGGRCEKSATCTRGYRHLGRAGMCNGGGARAKAKAAKAAAARKGWAPKGKGKKPRGGRKPPPAPTFSKLFLAVRMAAATAFAKARPDHGRAKPGKGKVRFAAVWLSGQRFTGGDVVLLHNPDGTYFSRMCLCCE